MSQIKFIVEPDETGLGRIIFEGRYYGVPAKATDLILNYLVSGQAIRQQRDELLDAAKYAKEVLGILWVSHHANRTDAAIEQIDAAIANAEAKP